LLAPLRVRAEAQRDIAWKQAGDCVAGSDFVQFLDDVAALAQSRLPLAQDSRLPKVAARILARQEQRAIKRGRKARNRDEADLHRLRIALKKLRYTAEFFAALYPRKKVKRYIQQVRRLQEHLGEINDIAHVRTTLSALQDKSEADNGDLRFAAGMVAGWYRARRPTLAKKALKRWDKFRQLKPFWI
jgi:CHAD domain-containing protein